ncbi:hypothetical protein [Nocardia sp. BMG51109]|uniref:hypothetical protein n=1 Tax=Nocardia sp. BMG51109 TaxID=1056816 RepID=UPI0004643B2A|nr:hypothetical protein [Nocardia sp. BMG51109]
MIPSRLAALVGLVTMLAVFAPVGLTPTARADDTTTLAAIEVTDLEGACVTGPPTFDAVVTAAAIALRGAVAPDRLADYDRRVGEFRTAMTTMRVHRDGLPIDPAEFGGRVAYLDDPIVSYLVNGLDAVRTGRIDQTVPVSALTVTEVVEVFVLATRIVKIPAQLAASLVPTVGFLLKPIVGAAFTGVQSLARAVQRHLAAQCAAPTAYPALDLEQSVVVEHVELPTPLVDLANSVRRADGACTPMAELTLAVLVERVRAYVTATGLTPDTAAVHAAADATQAFLRDNRVASLILPRRTEELGPLVDALDYGPVTFLANAGFSVVEGKALDTVPLGEVRVENTLDLTTLTLDVLSLLLTAGNSVLGLVGVGTPLSIVQTLAFAPTTYGAPVLKGVLQSMCAV